MTNQETIRLIRNLPTMCEFTDAYGEPIDSDAYYEAVEMAISALEAQDAHPEIIRCDKCKNGTHSGRGYVYICKVSPELTIEHAGDFYCGYAERREDG